MPHYTHARTYANTYAHAPMYAHKHTRTHTHANAIREVASLVYELTLRAAEGHAQTLQSEGKHTGLLAGVISVQNILLRVW